MNSIKPGQSYVSFVDEQSMGKNRKRGRLIVISAPSGTGKTTVIHRFLSKHPNLSYSISCTTRPKRINEVDGKDYRFVDKKTFEDLVEEGKLAEWAHVHEHMYGTPKGPIDEAIGMGKDILLDIDVIGGMNLKELYKDDAISIFLLPPSKEELKRRLLGRNTDSKEQQQIRLRNALEEMNYKDKYDYQVINDDLDKACSEIEKIIF